MMRIELYPFQYEFIFSKIPNLLLSGPFGSSKSFCLCHRALNLLLKYPGIQGLILRKEFKHLKNTTMAMFIERICPREVILDINRTDHFIRFKNGSKLFFGGLDQWEKLGSYVFGFIGVEEGHEFKKEVEWQMIQSRIRQMGIPETALSLFIVTVPDSPHHPLYRMFFENRDEKYKVIFGKTVKKFLPRGYIERLQSLSGVFRMRYVEGKWVAFEDIVFDCFDPRRHILVKDPFSKNEITGYIGGIDWGYTNPFVFQIWAEIQNGERFLLVKEYYKTKISPSKIKDIIITENLKYNFKHIGAGFDQPGLISELKRAGVNIKGHTTQDIKKEVQEIYEMIASDRILFLEKALVEMDPLLSIENKPYKTVMEFQYYRWDTKKEKPILQDDHGISAMRYALLSSRTKLDKVLTPTLL